MAIAVVSIPVSDPGRSRKFYEEVMNFHLLRDDLMGPEARWVQLQPRDGGATIVLVTWFDAMPPGSAKGTLLHVEDVDAERARLIAAGATPTEIGEEHWGRYTMLSDPDGNGWVIATLTVDA